jgi:hypothetical protein
MKFQKKFIISVISVAKQKKHHRLCLYICLGQFCSVYLAISVWIYIVLTAMKQGDEALNASSLQFLSSVKCFIASSLRFFLSINRFIAFIFYGKPSFNASSLLIVRRNSSFNASSLLLFKVTLPTFASQLGVSGIDNSGRIQQI